MEKSRKCVSIGRVSVGNGVDLALSIAKMVNDLKVEDGRKIDMITGIMNGLRTAANLLEASKYDGERCARILADAAKLMTTSLDEAAKEMEDTI